jgi:hypothetical protein
MTFLKKLIPKTFRSSGNIRSFYTIMKHIMVSYGWWKSIVQKKCIDQNESPIPWMTYPSIDFLSQFDYSNKTVFEYGAGNSTLFWAKRAKKVVSVESEIEWYNILKPILPSNCELLSSSRDVNEYVNHIKNYPKFDIIVIDGIGEARLLAAEIATQYLADGGMIILDNSDMWIKSATSLRKNENLIQVDFTGFTPSSPIASTTSIYLSRNSNLIPLNNIQPKQSVAQPGTPWTNA